MDGQFTEQELKQLQMQLQQFNQETGFVSVSGADAVSAAYGLNGAKLRIAEDQMTAWLTLNPPPAGWSYQREEILKFLQMNGIVLGYHNSNISAIIKKNIYNKEVKVAAGIVSKGGHDGYFDYRFTPQRIKEPAVRADGSVDYSSMGILQNVKKGDVVAVYHHAVQGSAGYTIRGGEMACSAVKELPPIRGRNISRLEDGVTYISEIDGKVEVKDNRLDVQNVHEIHGDVNFVNGRVEFYGDIVIYGNVEAGVVIRAGRNITIRGITEGATIFAGGDVVMQRGLVGGKKAKISARGSVFADFVENATIDAKKSVKANVIMNSQISAGGRVVVTGERGSLIGGFTHGLMGVEAANIGNEVEVKTVVHAGFDGKTYMKYLDIYKKEQENKNLLEQITGETALLLQKCGKKGGKPGGEDMTRLAELNRRKEECLTRQDDLKLDRKIVEEVMENGRGAMVVSNGPIYRGVIVCIENAQMPLEHNTCYMKYSCKGGIVSGSVIVI